MSEDENDDYEYGILRGRGRVIRRGRGRIIGRGRGRGGISIEERGNRDRIDSRRERGVIRRYMEYNYYREREQNYQNNSSYIPKIEFILSYPQLGKEFAISNNKNKMKLDDFKKRNLMKFEEDILFYCSSPKTLENYKSNIDDDKNYDFNIDIDSEYFMACQNERFKTILSNTNFEPLIKEKKLSNYKNSFCVKASLVEEAFEKKIVNSNIIRTKLDEYSTKIMNETNLNNVLNNFNELKSIFQKNIIDMEYLGLIQFNFIENNLILLLNLIQNKFEQEKNTKLLTEFILICIDLLKYFKSSNLYFYIIKNIIQNKAILLENSLNSIFNESIIQFLPNNCIDFSFISRDNIRDAYISQDYIIENNILISNLKDLLIANNIIEGNISDKRITNNIVKEKIRSIFDPNQYWTINYDNYLILFFISFKKIYEKNDFFLYLKVDIIEKKIIHIGKIKLFGNENQNKKEIVDLNISIKNELIYIIYIYNNINDINSTNDRILKYNIYCAIDMDLLESKDIIYKKNFNPSRLFNDRKYFYCFSDSNKLLMTIKKSKLDNIKYINFSIRIYDPNMNYTKIKEYINDFHMYNSLYFNNLFILEKKNINKKYIGKFYYNNNNYILNIYPLQGINNYNIKITYNNYKFIVTLFKEENNYSKNSFNLYMNMTFQNYNDLIDQNIKLLPFKNISYNNNYPDNLYEYLLQEYSTFLNLCGNFDLVNKRKEHNLIKFPFSLCCNFEENKLDFLINEIIVDNTCDNVKLYYIIIVKQIICCLYNGDTFKEEKINELINYFNKLILIYIKKENENKIFTKILKEIIIISSYINNNSILEINDIKFELNNEKKIINNKTYLLLIELLLEQIQTKKKKELYDYIIQLEKNNLLYILKNINNENYNNLDLSYYFSLKRVMNKASETFLIISEHFETELLSLTLILADCIEDICEEYQKLFFKEKHNKIFDKIFYIYNSFIFRTFFIIIEKLLATKKILREEKIITSIYKVLLTFNIISKYLNESEYYDTNNIIEITNESFNENDNRNYNNNNNIIKIEMKESKGIIIKTYGQYIEGIMKILLKKINNENIKFEFGREYAFNKIKEIYIFTKQNMNVKNKFIIKIIPLKDEDGYYKFKNNQDYKLILLIQKAIIHYLLFLFEDIHSKIDSFNKDKTIKNHIKLYQTDIFKFMSIPDIESMKSSNIIYTPFSQTTNTLIQDINKTFNGKYSNANELINNLTVLIEETNKNKNFDKENKNPNFINIYKKKIKNINQLEYFKNKKKENDNDDKKYNKLFFVFQYNLLSKKNLLINKIKKNEKLDLLISKIFLFGIKYYNCINKLNCLVKEIEVFKEEDIKDNINKIQSIKNYTLFYGLYEASSRMKLIYQEQKNGFNDLHFEEEMEKYFKKNLEKIEFMYQNIIPSEKEDINPNISIINNILSLIENKDLSIDEIKQYFQIQNFNSQIKFIEMTIINNLLLYLNNENIIIFLLYLISKIIRNVHNKLNTFFENIYCVDYFIMEKLKYQFHLFLHILSYKIINGQNKYTNQTKIALTESLLWKIRGRNFPILLEIIEVFKGIKTEKKQKNDLFIFDYERIYNVNYFNEKNTLEIQFEIFKIIVNQIMKKIIDILKSDKQNNINIERNPSNISEEDYKNLFKRIISYFIDINPECLYYYDLNLFFYKLFINSQSLQNIILQSYPNLIIKIIKIVLGIEKCNDSNNSDNIKDEFVSRVSEHDIIEEEEDEEYNNNNQIILNRLIMLKLLCKIIENIKDSNIDDLSECIKIFEKENTIIENPFIYLYEKISNNQLKNEEKLLSRYYNKLLFLCLNKIFESKKNGNIIQNLIQNNFYSIINLLFDDNSPYISENNFIIKTEYSIIFEKEGLFNSEETKHNNKGKIICFLKSKKMRVYEYTDNYNYNYNYNNDSDDSIKIQNNYIIYLSLKSYIKDNTLNFFDKSFFRYNIKGIPYENHEEETDNVLVIMEDSEKSAFNILNSIKMKNICELTILKNDNETEKIFISNNSKLIIDIIKEVIIKDNLNEKGMYILLRILSKLINHINKEDLLLIFKYLWKYYEKNKIDENYFVFLSLEFIEDFFDKNINVDSSYYKNIFKEEDQNKSLSSLFNYIIEKNSLKIYLKKNGIKIFEFKLTFPINDDSTKYYTNKNYKLTNLSFYKCHDIYYEELINDNSILFIKSISDNDIEDLLKKIEQYNQKIKVIIVSIIKVDETKIKNFLEKTKVLIYVLDPFFYKNLIEFFVEGKGINDYYKSLNNKFNEKDDFEDYDYEDYDYGMLNNKRRDHYFFYLKSDLNKEENKKQILENFKYNRNELYNEIISNTKIHKILNLKLIKRLIYDILYSDSIEMTELEKIFEKYENIVYIYEVLCMEYYFNIKHNLSNEVLKNKLKKYLLKIPLKSNDNENNNNQWLFCYINKFILFSDSKITYEQYLNYFDKKNMYNENKLFNQFFYLYNNVSYDKLLFLTNHFYKMKNKENFIQIYFNALSRITENICLPEFEKKKNELGCFIRNYKTNKINDYFESFFLLKIINFLYEYYIDLNLCNSLENQLYKNSIILSNIHKIMKVFIEEQNFDDYINDENDTVYRRGYRGRYGEREYRGKKIFTKKISLLFQYIFKYFDFCLFLYFKDQNSDILKYWIKSENKLFKFYGNLKVLLMEKNYKKNDYKENISLIALYSNLINFCNKDGVINDKNFKMKINEINKYILTGTNDLSFKNEINSLNENINKICIFCLENDKSKKYIFQDIINVKDMKRFNEEYRIKVNKDIYLVPLENVMTSLYAFDHSSSYVFNNLLNYYNVTKNVYEFNNLIKIEEIPKYSWNIGYGEFKYLLLSENDNKIYIFNSKKEEISRNSRFILDPKINEINTQENKIVDFIQGPQDSPPFLFNEKGEIFSINENNYKYMWLEERERACFNYPLKITLIPEVKIKSISANYNECYMIDYSGNLYQNIIYNNYYERQKPHWENVTLKEKNKKFIQCKCGDGYLLCLVKDINGKCSIYAKGNNNVFQCGVFMEEGLSSNIRGKNIENLTPCSEIESLDFQSIYANKSFSAAITRNWKLYIWGLKDKADYNILPIQKPTLVTTDFDKDLIIEQISLGYDQFFAIGRTLENGNYIKKLFSLEVEKSKDKEKFPFVLKEVKIMNIEENHSRIVPIKVLVDKNKTYVLAINEGNLINFINENKKNQINNDKDTEITINVLNNKDKYNLDLIKQFYNSDNLKKFMNSFNSLTNKNILKFVSILEEMKKKNNEFSLENIKYIEFINCIEGKNEAKDLLILFQKDEGNILFEYLKSRILIFQKYIDKFIFNYSAIKSNGLFQKILLKNYIYITEDKRISYFNELFLEDRQLYYNERSVITIDRFKANNFYEKFNESSEKIPDIEFTETIFGQIFQNYKNTNGKKFILQKNERLYTAELLGERAVDAGGPYHETISLMCIELQSNYINLFIKTANNKYNIGELRDKFIVNPDSNEIIYQKAYEFIGKMMAMSISSGEALNLNLHPIIWKSILENEISFEEYKTIDYSFFNSINELEKQYREKDSNLFLDFYFVIQNSNDSNIELIEKGKEIKVTQDNLEKYINLVKEARLNEIKNQVEYIKNGLFSAISKNVIQILTWNQLEEMVCGKNKLDIKEFKAHTVYEGYNGKEEIIIWFWEWLEQTEENEKFKYLKFVSGRTRLPISGIGYNYTHRIIKVSIENKFPRAATCFFTLKLPNYNSRKEFIEKIKYSIENCTDITDH